MPRLDEVVKAVGEDVNENWLTYLACYGIGYILGIIGLVWLISSL